LKSEDFVQLLSKCPSYSYWENIGIKNHHGIVIPIFSLRTKKSCGVGEFPDLFLLVDWCKQVGFDVIQLLPLNEMGDDDFSPYNTISSCALEPLFLGLRHLDYLHEFPSLEKKLDNFEKLNNLKNVDYKKLKEEKYIWLKEYFDLTFSKIEQSPNYKNFIKQNTWLQPYAIFKILKEEHTPLKWNRWPEKLKNISEKLLKILLERYNNKCHFLYFLQYLCFKQMEEIKEYSTDNKIFIKGDIPILINRNSADVWYYRQFFDVVHSAGCPPDDFNSEGQNWGFPLFNWSALKADGFSWWKRRLNVASSCYHLFRIDHAIGFFRIWTMLKNENALEGKFLPKHPDEWERQGRENLLMLLHSSSMIPIAEDLGLIPKMAYKVLKELGICGTKVVRWQKKFGNFIKYNKYEPISVTTLGTHDMPLMAEWWHKFPSQAKKFSKFNKWKYFSDLTFENRKDLLKQTHNTSSILHINLLQEYLALFPDLVFEDPKEERINVAGLISEKNWTYRTKVFLEDIISHQGLINILKEIIP
jgi:4-alpha-glucanotransferase